MKVSSVSETEYKNEVLEGYEGFIGLEYWEYMPELIWQITQRMEFPNTLVRFLRIVGIAHQMRVLEIESGWITQAGSMSQGERRIVLRHILESYEILKDVGLPGRVARIMLEHHERENGSGFPYGLMSRDIGIGGKILGVADVVCTLCGQVIQRVSAPGLELAAAELRDNRGILYDDKVVGATLTCPSLHING